MSGKGTFVENFNPRSCSMGKSRNSYNEKLVDVIVIDDDGGSDPSSDVILIDGTESLQDELEDHRVQGRRSNFVFEDLISIDDDDEDEKNDDDSDGSYHVDHNNESSVSSQPGNGVEVSGDFDSDATSSKPFCSTGRYSWLRSNEGRATRERGSTSKSVKCSRTSYKRPFRRNHYNLSSEHGSSSFDNEFSDCEIMEDSCGDVRKQWEQASRKRKKQVGSDDQSTASASPSETFKNYELGKKSAQHPEATVCSISSNWSCDKEKSAAFAETENYKKEREFFCTLFQSGSSGHMPTCRAENCPSNEKTCGESHLSADQRDANENSSRTTSSLLDKEPICTRRVNTCDLKSNLDIDFDKKLPVDDGEDDALLSSKHRNKTHVNCDGVVFTDSEGTYSMPSGCNNFSDSQLKYKKTTSINTDNGIPGQPPNTCQSDRTQANCIDASDSRGNRNMFFVSSPSFGKSGYIGSGTHLRADEIVCGEIQSERIESAAAHGQCYETEMLQVDSHIITPYARDNIITYREKLKETDEYKRAMEKEWAARQEQLRIQAEEAQRLRKRRRAESMRLLEMKRRQKQRVEEIRDTQKKDVENMNLKEQIQSLVRKELHVLELKSCDMASLLHGLGIHVEGGFSPSSQEVHAAYKHALLKFHPDRASRTDIRQQVEAEEKFKLITRMKEKLL